MPYLPGAIAGPRDIAAILERPLETPDVVAFSGAATWPGDNRQHRGGRPICSSTSTMHTVPVSISIAQAFLEFLKHIFPTPERSLFNMRMSRLPAEIRSAYKKLLLPIPKQYARLVLVGHSMGAVIIRAAILQSANNKLASARQRRVSMGPKRELIELRNVPILHAQVRLFAPAHFGANPAGCSWLNYGQAFRELSDNSLILRDLKDQTTAFAELIPTMSAFRAKSVWGTGESIVSVGNYQYDHESEQVERLSHFEVCKPTLDYTLPLMFTLDYGTGGWPATRPPAMLLAEAEQPPDRLANRMVGSPVPGVARIVTSSRTRADGLPRWLG